MEYRLLGKLEVLRDAEPVGFGDPATQASMRWTVGQP